VRQRRPPLPRAAGVPGRVGAPRRLGAGPAPGPPERQHRVGTRLGRPARGEHLPRGRVAVGAPDHRLRRGRGLLPGTRRDGRARDADADRPLLHPGPPAGTRPEHRVRTVRVRALEPFRRPDRLQRRRRRDRHPREQRRVGARAEREPRLHPHGQHGDHQPDQGAPAGDARRHRPLSSERAQKGHPTMRIGIFAGDTAGRTIDDVVAEARGVAEDGFAGYWIPNIFGLDALTVLAVVGREVPRIELGTAVVPTYPRHAMTMAQTALTVQAITGNRLALGIGLSHQFVVEGMWGLSFERPVRHMREYLEILTSLVRTGKVDFDGETMHAHGGLNAAGAEPVPILLAALGTRMLELAGGVADGTVTWMTGPDTLATHTVPTITHAAEAAGRPAPRIAAGLPVLVTDDVE